MPGDPGLVEIEVRGDLAAAALPSLEEADDLNPARMGKGLADLRYH